MLGQQVAEVIRGDIENERASGDATWPLPPGADSAFYEAAMSLSDRICVAVSHQEAVSVPFGITLHAQAQRDAVEAVVTAALRQLVHKARLSRFDVARAIN